MGLAGLSAFVGGGVFYAHHATAVREANLRLQTNGIGVGVTVTVSVVARTAPHQDRPTPSDADGDEHGPPEPSVSSVKTGVTPGNRGQRHRQRCGRSLRHPPRLHILVPMPVSPSDPAQITCSAPVLRLAPAAEATETCFIRSQNGFSGALAVSCQHFIGLTPAIANDCTVPATINLPANGVATGQCDRRCTGVGDGRRHILPATQRRGQADPSPERVGPARAAPAAAPGTGERGLHPRTAPGTGTGRGTVPVPEHPDPD